jgi:hypothetical protein
VGAVGVGVVELAADETHHLPVGASGYDPKRVQKQHVGLREGVERLAGSVRDVGVGDERDELCWRDVVLLVGDAQVQLRAKRRRRLVL